MKNKYIFIIIGVILLVGCSSYQDDPVSELKINISDLNQQRVVSKNMIDFEDNQQGKRDLLMLMINSVDYYNLVSGKMNVKSTYLNNQTQMEYEFQVNIPEYESYIYCASSSGYGNQIMFRDNKKMYFLKGDKNILEKYSFQELIDTKKISIEEIDKDNNLFMFANWSLEERFEDNSITRVANDLFGDVAPYLLPEDIALRQLGIEVDSFKIKGKEKYLNRDAFLIEGEINNNLYVEGGMISMLVDRQTGIILKYIRRGVNSKVEMEMKDILIDDEEIDLYKKYVK